VVTGLPAFGLGDAAAAVMTMLLEAHNARTCNH
jgi:hypothetical protein